jgi:hypothetical protein
LSKYQKNKDSSSKAKDVKCSQKLYIQMYFYFVQSADIKSNNIYVDMTFSQPGITLLNLIATIIVVAAVIVIIIIYLQHWRLK